MLGSYSRCAERASERADRFTRSGSRAPRMRPRLFSLSLSRSHSLLLSLAHTRSGNATLPSLRPGPPCVSVRSPCTRCNVVLVVRREGGAEGGGGAWRGRRKKKEEDLGQFLSHKPADRAAPIKNASLRMAIGPQRGSGGNAEPRALFLHPPPPLPSHGARPPPPRHGVSVSSFALSRGTALLVLRSATHPPHPLPPPTFSPRLAPTTLLRLAAFFSLFFFAQAGKKCAPPVDWSRGQMT